MLSIKDRVFLTSWLHLLASSSFSHQFNSLHKCFVSRPQGSITKGVFDLISVMHREIEFWKTTTNNNNNNMLLGSHGALQWEHGAFVPTGQIRYVHLEDPPVLCRLGERTQLECINE